jgi:sugar phosphate isomerase/epimerase
MKRRAFLAAAAAAVYCPPITAHAAGRRRFFDRHDLPIGLQLYALGEAPVRALDEALAKISHMGYRTVELPGYLGHSPARWRAALDRAGLRCTGIHMPLIQDLTSLARDARTIGVDRIIQPMFDLPEGASFALRPGESHNRMLARITSRLTPAFWRSTARKLNHAGEALAKEGLQVGYHNHNVEFAPSDDGTCGMDILLRETDPKHVTFEADIGWIAAAGLDPAVYLARHRGRFELAHLKDVSAATRPNFGFAMQSVPVGAGVLRWDRILPAAFDAGVRRFFVEQDKPFAPDMFAQVAQSHAYLDKLVA